MSESLRILVIEDDPSISEVVCAHLTRQGHCCVGAFSGTEGMLHLEHGDGSVAFDLVITDLMLPGMTGLAQVSGNICLPLEERYKLDVYYVDHFSLSLDIRILLRTVGVVLLGEGRYAGRPLVHTGEGAGQSGARHPGP